MSWIRILAVLGALTLATPWLYADGFLYKKGGYLKEEHQAAFIEWHEGKERLYVETRAQGVASGTLWIVPIIAPPDQVKAEPVTTRPQVRYAKTFLHEADSQVLKTLIAFALADSGAGLLLGPVLAVTSLGSESKGVFSQVGSVLGGSGGGVVVHDRVVKLGMTIEVLSAVSVSALDDYLAGKQLDVKAKDLWSLAPYLEQQAAIVCAWASGPLEARAMRIDFPTPRIFFPLRPSQVYKDPISTDIYVRGFAKPPPGFLTPWIRIEPVSADLSDGEKDQPLTRVHVTGSPSSWNEDVWLEPGGTLRWNLRWFVVYNPLGHPWAVITWTGMLAGLLLPILLIPRPQRQGRDFLLGALTGAGIGLSLFCTWFIARHWHGLRRQGLEGTAPFTVGSVLILFISLHLLLVVGWCVGVASI